MTAEQNAQAILDQYAEALREITKLRQEVRDLKGERDELWQAVTELEETLKLPER